MFQVGTALGTKPSVFLIIVLAVITLHRGLHIGMCSKYLPQISSAEGSCRNITEHYTAPENTKYSRHQQLRTTPMRAYEFLENRNPPSHPLTDHLFLMASVNWLWNLCARFFSENFLPGVDRVRGCRSRIGPGPKGRTPPLRCGVSLRSTWTKHTICHYPPTGPICPCTTMFRAFPGLEWRHRSPPRPALSKLFCGNFVPDAAM